MNLGEYLNSAEKSKRLEAINAIEERHDTAQIENLLLLSRRETDAEVKARAEAVLQKLLSPKPVKRQAGRPAKVEISPDYPLQKAVSDILKEAGSTQDETIPKVEPVQEAKAAPEKKKAKAEKGPPTQKTANAQNKGRSLLPAIGVLGILILALLAFSFYITQILPSQTPQNPVSAAVARAEMSRQEPTKIPASPTDLPTQEPSPIPPSPTDLPTQEPTQIPPSPSQDPSLSVDNGASLPIFGTAMRTERSASFSTDLERDSHGNFYAIRNDGLLYRINVDGSTKDILQFPRAYPDSHFYYGPALNPVTDELIFSVRIHNSGYFPTQLYAASMTGEYRQIGGDFEGSSNPAVDREGNVYIASSSSCGNDTLYRIRPDGTQEAFLGNLCLPRALEIAPNGDIYISNLYWSTIYRINPNDASYEIMATGLSNPSSIGFDYYGNVYVANYDQGSIVRYTPSGERQLIAAVEGATGLEIDVEGNLYTGSVVYSNDWLSVSYFLVKLPFLGIREQARANTSPAFEAPVYTLNPEQAMENLKAVFLMEDLPASIQNLSYTPRSHLIGVYDDYHFDILPEDWETILQQSPFVCLNYRKVKNNTWWPAGEVQNYLYSYCQLTGNPIRLNSIDMTARIQLIVVKDNPDLWGIWLYVTND